MEFIFKKEKKEKDEFKTIGVTIPNGNEEGVLICNEFFAVFEDLSFIRFYEESEDKNCFVKEDDVYILNEDSKFIKYDSPFLRLGVYLIKKEGNKKIFKKLKKKIL